MAIDLPRLVPDNDPNSRVKMQETTFSHDVLGRYICNTWDEIFINQNGGYPFDVIVIGAGMFGAYAAEKLYRHGASHALRILLIDAGTFVLGTHAQNLPQRLGGDISGAPLRTKDDGTKNAIWGMPWISNESFPGLAYCIGGRSLFWGGWAPRLTDDDLAMWPAEVRDYLAGPNGVYPIVEEEIGVSPTTDYIRNTDLFSKLKAALEDAATKKVKSVTKVEEAPLAVQGSSPTSGVFSFDKFSSGPFLIDAIRHDAANNFSHGDVSRRIFLLPRTQVLRLIRSQNRVTALELSVDGARQSLSVPPRCAVLLANSTIEATRLALDGLGIGSTKFGSPRVGNLMAHLRSNITVRIRASALGLTPPYKEAQTTALFVRGVAHNRRFHIQITAAALGGADPEKNLWSMVPDIDQLAGILANQSTDWISITFRCIGEMEDHRTLDPDPARSWTDLSTETDRWGIRRVYTQLAATPADEKVWTTMDQAAFDLAETIAGGASNIEYWEKGTQSWNATRPQPAATGRNPWQDTLGTTHHEAGTLFMGAAGASITNSDAKFHDTENAYVVGPAAFPTLGSANPSLTGLALALRTARAVVRLHELVTEPGFVPLSLAPADWRIERRPPNANARLRHYGNLLEALDGYGLAFYTKEAFGDFILQLEWRVARRDDNSGVYVRTPGPGAADPLGAADREGHEIQIDERGFDTATNTEGHPQKMTGAFYDIQAPFAFPSAPIGAWNTFRIEARAAEIKVSLNGNVINALTSPRRLNGFLALQLHHFTSRVQFRHLQVKRL